MNENHTDDDRLPVMVSSSDGACVSNSDDFRSPLVRQRKSRSLDLTVQKLWKFKLGLQLESASVASDVISADLERSKSLDQESLRSGSRDNDLGCDRQKDEPVIQSRGLVEMQPSFGGTDVDQMVESRSWDQCEGQGHSGTELKLRRVVATPGEDEPLFYTSLMRLQSTKRKSQPTQVFVRTLATCTY